MKNMSLFICDEDDIYVEKLSSYLMRRSFTPFLVKTCNAFSELPKDYEKEGILLVSSRILLKVDETLLNQKRTLILGDGRVDSKYEAYEVVDKYQSANAIYEQLLNCYDALENIDGIARKVNRPLEVRGVYSPIHRIGKSAYAKKLCDRLGAERKVLLMNLEFFSKEIYEGMGLSELIYYYKQEKIRLAFSMPDMFRNNDMYDYIGSVHCPYDLNDMTVSEWLALIDCIEMLDKYDVLVIDFDHLPDVDLMKRCKRIYVPYIRNEGEDARMEGLEQLMRVAWSKALDDRIEKVLLEA